MKTLVIYNSQTGFTCRYAQELARRVQAECVDLKTAQKKDLSGYDAIVFGSWARAGMIHSLSWFKKKMKEWPDKLLIVYATGAAPADTLEAKNLLAQNFSEKERERIHVFYCPGGFSFQKLGFSSRMMIGGLKGFLHLQQKKSPKARQTLEMLSQDFDLFDPRFLDPMIRFLDPKRPSKDLTS